MRNNEFAVRSTQPSAADSAAFGQRLRDLRKLRRTTLEKLAAQTGVSRAMLSKIERGENGPSLQVAIRIASGLGLSLSDLLVSAPPRLRRVELPRKDQPVFRDTAGFTRRMLSPHFADRRVDFLHHSLSRRSSTGPLGPYPGGTAKHLVVERGCLEVTVEDDAFLLSAGDALYFEADVLHSFRNAGRLRCEYYLVVAR